MLGRRLYCEDTGRFFIDPEKTVRIEAAAPGDYWHSDLGWWAAVCPNGRWANLRNHAVTEHADGTITVSPSILLQHGQAANPEWDWHGFLERGVWRNC